MEYRDEIIDAFKNGTFSSEFLKQSDAAAHNYVLKDVDNSIQETKSIKEEINLSLYENVFELLPADYAKMLINIKDADENKGIVAEAKNRISDLKDRIKGMNETAKKKNADETLEIIKKILDYHKNAQKIFQHASRLDKGESKPKPEESIAERVKLRRQKMDIIRKKKENLNNEFFSHYFDYLNPAIMFKRLRDANDEKNKDLVKSINKKLTKLKNIVKKVAKVEQNEKIIDIVERSLDLDSENQSGKGLKILIPIQMLSRLPIFLAQLKAGNNSEKLKNEIRYLLYSLYRSKKLTKQLKV